MRINKWYFKVLFIAGTLFFASCSNDSEPQLPRGDYDNGILISGEGSGAGTGSVSFISDDLTTEESLIYKKVNNAELGTFLQSLAFDDSRAFIVVDNQNTITAVNRFTFEKLGEITTGLETPRYLTIVNNKGYVTNWGTSGAFVAVVDLTTYQVEEKIAISNGPERIVYRNDRLYVSHKGGFGSNNVISVIEISSKNVQEITVKDKPDEMFFNNSGDLIVLSEGKAAWTGNETLAAISKINLSDNSVTEILFPMGVHPSLFEFKDAIIYYNIGTEIFKMDATSTVLPTTEFVTVELLPAVSGYSDFYGMTVNDGKLFTLITSFSDVGKLDVYNLTDNSKIKTLGAPIGASKIYFN